MNAGTTYIAQVEGDLSDRINVSGTAASTGALRIVPLSGAYSFAVPYTLLSAAGGLAGTSFSPVDTAGAFGDGRSAATAMPPPSASAPASTSSRALSD